MKVRLHPSNLKGRESIEYLSLNKYKVGFITKFRVDENNQFIQFPNGFYYYLALKFQLLSPNLNFITKYFINFTELNRHKKGLKMFNCIGARVKNYYLFI